MEKKRTVGLFPASDFKQSFDDLRASGFVSTADATKKQQELQRLSDANSSELTKIIETRAAKKAPDTQPAATPQAPVTTPKQLEANSRFMLRPGGWLCISALDAVQYSRMRRAGIVTQYPGCSQSGVPVSVRLLQSTSIAGTPVVNVGNPGGTAWTMEEDLVELK